MATHAPLEVRLWRRIHIPSEDSCWEWQGASNSVGYGRIYVQPGMSRFAHRLAYERLRGPIPDGLVLDHLCRNKLCCNPAHLEPVTQRENVIRGFAARMEEAA